MSMNCQIKPISSFKRLENLVPSKGGKGVIEDGSKSLIVCGRSLFHKRECPQGQRQMPEPTQSWMPLDVPVYSGRLQGPPDDYPIALDLERQSAICLV